MKGQKRAMPKAEDFTVQQEAYGADLLHLSERQQMDV